MKTVVMQILEELKEYGFSYSEEREKLILETEKQQIIDARVDGVAKSLTLKIDAVDLKLSEQYYTSTFETNKETLK